MVNSVDYLAVKMIPSQTSFFQGSLLPAANLVLTFEQQHSRKQSTAQDVSAVRTFVNCLYAVDKGHHCENFTILQPKVGMRL